MCQREVIYHLNLQKTGWVWKKLGLYLNSMVKYSLRIVSFAYFGEVEDDKILQLIFFIIINDIC